MKAVDKNVQEIFAGKFYFSSFRQRLDVIRIAIYLAAATFNANYFCQLLRGHEIFSNIFCLLFSKPPRVCFVLSEIRTRRVRARFRREIGFNTRQIMQKFVRLEV